MALLKINFFSKALGMQSSFYAIIPQQSVSGEIGNPKNTKTNKNLLLLHGLSDNETIWLRRTSIERYADEYGISVFMPCAEKSFYTDMKFGSKFYTYIAHEVPRIASEFLNISHGKNNWYVAGLSMGGYGALKIALKESERFCSGAALSPVTMLENPLFKETLIPVVGENSPIPEDEDLFRLSEKYNSSPEKPRLLAIIGKDDFMYDDYVKFINHMNTLDYDFTHAEYEGKHTWDFWDLHIKDVLNWMFEV